MSVIYHAKKLLRQIPKLQQSATLPPTAPYSSCGNGKCPMIRIVGCGPRIGYECKKKKKRCKCVKVDAPSPSFSECLRCPPPPRRITECPNCCFVAFSPRLNPPKHCTKPNYGTSIDGCNPPDSMRMLGSCRPRNMGCKKVNEPCDYVDPSIVVCDPCIKPYRNECSPPCRPVPALIESPPCYAPKPSCVEAKPECNTVKRVSSNTRPICVKPKPSCIPQPECPEPVVFHYNQKPQPAKSVCNMIQPLCDEPKPEPCEEKPPCKLSVCSAPKMKSSVFLKLKPKPSCGLPAPVCSQAPTSCEEPKPAKKQLACVKLVPQPACEEPPPVCVKLEPVCAEPQPICEAPQPICEAPQPPCETEPVSEPKLDCCPPEPACEEAKPMCEEAVQPPEPSPCQFEDKPICCSKAVCNSRATPREMEAALKTCRPCDEAQDRPSEIMYSRSVSCPELRSSGAPVSAKKSVITLFDSLLDLVNLRRK